MARILAIDYGLKRCGLAVTDPLQLVASPLETITTHTLGDFLKEYFQKEQVEKVLIGYPVNLKGEDTHSTSHVRGFIKRFVKSYPDIQIIERDERFTSKQARQSLVDMGTKKKNREKKESLDQISATIILQEYLQQNTMF